MKTLHLHGFLKEKYGAEFQLEVATPAEAVRALAVQIPGFEADIRAGSWHVLRGPLDEERSLDDEGISMRLGQESEVHLIPAVEGAGNGVFQTVVGIILIVAGIIAIAYGHPEIGYALIGTGVGMTVSGIITMTTKIPGSNKDSQENVDDRASFLFNGPTNTSSQGVAVPRGYGRVRVGSIVASAALYAEELSA